MPRLARSALLDAAREETQKARILADGRLIHMVKGLAGSALTASEVAASQLRHSSTLTPSAESNVRSLVTDASNALKEAIDYCVSRQVFSEVETGTYATQMAETDVGELLEAALRHAEGVVEIAGEQRLLLRIDTTMMRMIVHEALGNSRKYRERESLIVISAAFADGRLRVVVENQNARSQRRLTDAECEACFTRGVRGHNASGTSTGVGLDTARKAANAAGGHVFLSTREALEPELTSFTALSIEFPAERVLDAERLPLPASMTPSAGAPLSVGSSSPLPESCRTSSTTGGYSSNGAESSADEDHHHFVPRDSLLPLAILIADDSRMNRMILKRVLALALHCDTIAEVASGDEMLEMTRFARFDVLFIDEEMGDGLNGSEAIAQLRAGSPEQLPSTAVIVSVTGGADDAAEVRRLLEVGADLVWGKPQPSVPEITEQILGALQAKRSRN